MLSKKIISFLLLVVALTGIARTARATDLPASYDWRNVVGNLTPIKSEGSCGSVYAFVLTAAMETAILIKQKLPVSLSEQYIMDCDSQGMGCNGGDIPYAMAVTPGFVLDSDYPYTGTAGSCNKNAPIFRQAQGFGNVANDASTGKPTLSAIKQAILAYGAVISLMDADGGLASYAGGVYAGSASASANSLNHAVNLIGWDDAGGYWIARNSWGINWGEHGYFRIKYGANGIGSQVSYLIYDPNNSTASHR